MPFKKGESGNPAGRPPNALNIPKLRNLIGEDNSQAIIETVVSKALEGDKDMLRLCFERLVPAFRAVDIETLEEREQILSRLVKLERLRAVE